MNNIQLPVKGKVSDQTLFQEIEGEAVLLNLTNEKYFGLNELGTKIWTLLAEHGDSESVIKQIRAEYDVSRDTIETDLSKLIDEFVQKGLFIVENE